MQYEIRGKWRLNGGLVINSETGEKTQNVWVKFGIVGDMNNCVNEISLPIPITTDSITEGIQQIDDYVNNYIANL